jgi:hypothetical protein
MRLLPILLFAAGCAGGGGSVADSDAELSRELASRTAGSPQDCLSLSPTATLVARERQTLVYESGATIWVNRLEAGCPGLRPLSPISVEVQAGFLYCRGSRLQAIDPGTGISGPVCRLGRFTPYRR